MLHSKSVPEFALSKVTGSACREQDSCLLRSRAMSAKADVLPESSRAKGSKSARLHESASDCSKAKPSFYIGDDQAAQMTKDCCGDTKKILIDGVSTPKPSITVQTLDHTSMKKPPEFVPPDGGYGWVIAICASISNIFVVGFIRSYGVIYVSIMQTFPGVSAYHASWLPALLSTMGFLIAPVAGVMCRRFTSRKVSFVGGLLSFLGIFLGSFARSMTELIIFMGVFTGLGAGLITTTGVLIVSLYFEKKRTLASAICMSGNSLGGFFFPPLIEYMLSEYGFRGTLMIISAMQLNVCAMSSMYRPIRLHAVIQEKERERKRRRVMTYKIPEDQSVGPNTAFLQKSISSKASTTSNRSFSKSQAFLQKVINSKLLSKSKQEKNVELSRQVSFLRTSSMMNSIPDLARYARSWSVSADGDYEQIKRPRLKKNHCSLYSKLSPRVENNWNRYSFSGGYSVTHQISAHRLSPYFIGKGSDRHVSLSKQVSLKGPRPPMLALPEKETDSQLSLPDSEALRTEECDQEPSRIHIHRKSLFGDNFYPLERISSSENIEHKEEEEEQEQPQVVRKSCCMGWLANAFECSLLKNRKFVLVAISVMFMATGAPHALYFLPAFITSINVDTGYITHILCTGSVVDLFGRLGVGFISDLDFVNTDIIYCLCSAIAGAATLLFPLATSVGTLGFLVGLYSFGTGGWFVLIPPLLANHHGIDKIAASYGLVRLFNGLVNFISPQVSGVLIDVTHGYVAVYVYMGIFMFVSAGMLLLEQLFITCRSKKENEVEESPQDIKFDSVV